MNKNTKKQRTSDWVREQNAAGLPCGPIYSIDEMFADEQVKKHFRIAKDVPNEQGRDLKLVAQPFSRTPGKMAVRPPEFGEQTDEIL